MDTRSIHKLRQRGRVNKDMSGVKELQIERKQLFEDVYSGRIPRRVPICAFLPIEFCIEYTGLPLAETQWTLEGIEEALDNTFQITRSDYCPAGFSRFPAHLQILGAKVFVMGSSGFIQHPEVTGMEVEDYDDLIANPYDCLLEKILPRLYPKLDADPITRSQVMAKAFKAFYDYAEAYERINARMVDKYGFYLPPAGSTGVAIAPFDFLADFLRGFKGILMDVKRIPERIVEACEAVLPLQIKKGMPQKPSKFGQTFIPLHMAPYLRPADFEKLYWPTLFKMVNIFSRAGQPCRLFCEQDWMRYLDYLYELPENTRLCFEYGDPRIVKEKLGKKHIISGFYPLTYLKTATKQQCIDKAKELLDILAPGGKYIFEFDKNPVSLDSVNVENYVAVLEYVAEHANYTNPGKTILAEAGTSPSATSFSTPLELEIPTFKSKYYKLWEAGEERVVVDSPLESIIAKKMQGYEEQLFKMLLTLV